MAEVLFVPVAFVQEMFVKKDGDVEETKRLLTARFVKEPFVEVTPVKEALVEVRFVIVPLLAVRAEMKLFAAFIVVPEAMLKPNHPEEVPFTKERFVKFVFVAWRVVAKRFVEVTLVAVTLPKFPFHLSAEDPRESVASRDGRRFVSTKPFTPRLVVVTDVLVTLVATRFPRFV